MDKKITSLPSPGQQVLRKYSYLAYRHLGAEEADIAEGKPGKHKPASRRVIGANQHHKQNHSITALTGQRDRCRAAASIRVG
jgi:hypothetical protein